LNAPVAVVVIYDLPNPSKGGVEVSPLSFGEGPGVRSSSAVGVITNSNIFTIKIKYMPPPV
jgi:hypothetical protein